jgi:hypothetical protein
MAMHDFIIDLQNQGKTVNCIGRGIVASAATYILMASKNAEMSKNSWLMIHNVSGGFWGDVNQMERYVTTLRQFNDRSRDFYAEYTGMRKEDITKLMNEETFMDAETAEKKGFIKNVSPAVAFTNKIPRDQWQFSNTSVLNAYNSAVKLPEETVTKTYEIKLQDDHKNYFDNKLETNMKNWIKNALGIKDTVLPENADKQAILNHVVEGLIPHLESLDQEVQTEIKNQVEEAVKGEAFTNAVKAAVAEQIKPFETKVS